MDNYGPATYGEGFASVYDEWFQDVSDIAGTAATIVDLARGGQVLELGVGSGRLAEPIAGSGVPIVGVDASPSMLTRLSDAVPAAEADMAVLPFRDSVFSVVFVAFNTLFNLPDSALQQACFHEAARVLTDDGLLVLEAFVPPAIGAGATSDVSVRTIEVDRVVMTVAKRDDAAQTISGQHIEMTASGNVMHPWFLHFLYPSQVDEAAAEANLRLVDRWQDWQQGAFGEHSSTHVSIYEVQP